MINNDNNRIHRCNSRFFTISLRRERSPTRTLKWPGRNRVQITCNTLNAYHVQHVVLRATVSQSRRGGNRSTRRKPLTTIFRKCHILKPQDSSPSTVARSIHCLTFISTRQQRASKLMNKVYENEMGEVVV